MTCGISIPLGQYIGKHHAMYDKKLPNIIFHYTNLHGIVGIVESKTFWLTKASYLNDYSEVNFFIDRLNYMINNLPTFGVSTELLDSVQKIILEMPRNCYVGSFCENGDLLSQWRGYTQNAVGISMGMNTQQLLTISNQNGTSIIPCIYDESEQNEIAISLILDTIKQLEQNKGTIPIDDIQKNILLAALACKNPSFFEEKEWRLVLIENVDSNKEDFGIRSNGSQLIPYYKFRLPDWSQKGIIEDCYIGPNAKFHEVAEGLQILISKNISQEFAIRESSIPYR